MDEEIYPVCSPGLLRERAPGRPADPAHETLVHNLSMDGHEDFASWSAWLDKAGVAEVAEVAGKLGLRINNSAAVPQAAIEGHGAALARSVMASDDPAAGRLVRLCPELRFDSPLPCYVIYRAECAGRPKLATFRDRLLAEANAAALPRRARVRKQAPRSGTVGAGRPPQGWRQA